MLFLIFLALDLSMQRHRANRNGFAHKFICAVFEPKDGFLISSCPVYHDLMVP